MGLKTNFRPNHKQARPRVSQIEGFGVLNLFPSFRVFGVLGSQGLRGLRVFVFETPGHFGAKFAPKVN